MASQLVKAVLLLCITTACFANVVPEITSVTPILSTTECTDHTHIIGSGFSSITLECVEISGVRCEDACVIDDCKIKCKAAPGVGQDNKVTITSSGGHHYSANVADFTLATIHACDAHPLKEVVVNPANPQTVTICGTGFSEGRFTDDKEGWTGRFEVDVAGFAGDIVCHTDTQLIVALPPSAAGERLPIRVVLGSQVLVAPNVVVTYPAPQVTSVEEDSTSKRSNGVRLGVYGRFFGAPNPSLVHVTVMVGQFPCVSINHVSDSELHCTVSGYGANRDVVVIVNSRSSSDTSAPGAAAVRYDFADPVTPGLTCTPPYGAADVLNPELCNCWSGSAPSSALYADCDVHAICPGRVTSQTVVSQSPPSRPVTFFNDDKLFITQAIPIVKNRRDTVIQFVTPKINPFIPAGILGASTCSYPGTIWAKTINELDCQDIYTGILEWSQHRLCGWVEDIHANIVNEGHTTIFYKTSLVTSYTETYKSLDGTLSFRKVSHAFMLSVSFKRKVVVLTETAVASVYIADPTMTGSLEVAVIGDALYDVASENTLITFETTFVWPYQIDDITLVGTWKRAFGNNEPGHVTATAVLGAIQPGELECDMVQDTSCGQSWLLTINTHPNPSIDPACNIQGTIEFSTGDLLCRDEETIITCPPGQAKTNFTITMGRTDLCNDEPDVDASLGLSHTLVPYYDSAFTVPQSTFQTGDMIFFQLRINDPSSTMDAITFQEIDLINPLLDDDQIDVLFKAQYPGAPFDDADNTVLSLALVEITQDVRQPGPVVSPGTDAVLTFQFRLLRNHLQSIHALSADSPEDLTQNLMIQATIDIWYHGNQKRTVVASGSLPSVSHAQISFYDVPEHEEELAANNIEAADDQITELSLFASSASTVFSSVLAAVGVAVALLA